MQEGNFMSVQSSQPRIDAACNHLIAYIRDQSLQPGDRLPNEQTLCSILNVGRGTLREAVKCLTTRNILTVRQGSGTYVSNQHVGVPQDPLGLTFIKKGPKLAIDLVEFRLMIEPELAARAAKIITEEQKTHLRALCDDLTQKVLTANEDYAEADARFHCYIAECSGNCVLQNLMPTIVSAVSITVAESGDAFRARAAFEHESIRDAICRGDDFGARNAMITHLNITRDYFARREYELKMIWGEI